MKFQLEFHGECFLAHVAAMCLQFLMRSLDVAVVRRVRSERLTTELTLERSLTIMLAKMGAKDRGSCKRFRTVGTGVRAFARVDPGVLV